MNKIYFLAILIIASFSVQAQRTVDFEVIDILSPADLRSSSNGTTIQITAVLKNNGSDSVFAGDSIAYQMVLRASNDAVITAIPNRSLLAVPNKKDLGVGDTLHFTTSSARLNANINSSADVKLQLTAIALNRDSKSGITPEVQGTLTNNTYTLNTVWYNLQGWGVGVESISRNQLVNAYPNPANESVRINWNISAINSRTDVSIMDMTGNVLKNVSVEQYENHLDLDVSHFVSGVYVVEVRSGEFVQTSKMTVQH